MAVQTPREVLVSLVDLNVIDASSLLNACLQEMSDAECKRVLNMLSLPSGSDSVDEPEEGEGESHSEEDKDSSPAEDEALDEDGDSKEEDPSPSEALQRRLVRLERLLRRLERNR